MQAGNQCNLKDPRTNYRTSCLRSAASRPRSPTFLQARTSPRGGPWPESKDSAKIERQGAPPERSGRGNNSVSIVNKGRLLNLHAASGYGFLSPLGAGYRSVGRNNVLLRLHSTKIDTGLLEVRDEDVFEYVSNEDEERPEALYARLVEPVPRSPDELFSYLQELCGCSIRNSEDLLRDVIACPAGFLQLLNLTNPPLSVLIGILELAEGLCHVKCGEGSLSSVRVKKFIKLFAGTRFLQVSVAEPELVEEHETLLKSFTEMLSEHAPESIPDVFPLLQRMATLPNYDCLFFVGLIAKQAGVGNSMDKGCRRNNLHLLRTKQEVADAAQDDWLSKLPCLKSKDNYESLEEYLETYFRLVKEDCFWGLKRALSELKISEGISEQGIRVWEDGIVLGIRFDTGYTGITFVMELKKTNENWRSPKNGRVLCLTGEWSDFGSPVWAVTVGSESKNRENALVFVKTFGEESEGFTRVLTGGRLLLIQSRSFYPAYGPALEALPEKAFTGIPFETELMRGLSSQRPPAYLEDESLIFCWKCLFECQKMQGNTALMSAWEGSFAKAKKEEKDEKEKEIETETEWFYGGIHNLESLMEQGHKTIADESQIAAVKQAQGPPGTGKTFVAVKLLELLLSADPPLQEPILVITNKNQAVDNFLLSCLDFCKELVRIGGGCKEPDLIPYKFSPALSRNSSVILLQGESEEALNDLERSGVFNEDTILKAMPDSQLRKFLSKIPEGREILNSVPLHVPIKEFVHPIERTQNTLQVSGIYRALSACISQWMPDKTTFEVLQTCLSFSAHRTGGVGEMNYIPRSKINPSSFDEIDSDSEDSSDTDVDDDNCLGFITRGTKSKYSLIDDPHFVRCDNANGFRASLAAAPSYISVDESHRLLRENPWDLNAKSRALLVLLILKLNYERCLKRIENLKRMYDESCEELNKKHAERDLDFLNSKKIIAMTTTGAAMHQYLLKKIKPSVVFVEEASEILEGQLLAVLHPEIQHLIMFGDQYELSPQVNSYELERNHSFGLSLFERLIKHTHLPFETLKLQGRMRDEFLPMLHPIYPHLRSNMALVSGRTNKVPDCMGSSIYLWEHHHPETKLRSCFNEGEADMCIFLVAWLLNEGERSQNITILACYSAQVKLIKRKIASMICSYKKPLKVCSVNRYQGCENKIVILSLVRSNKGENIGVLAKRNRLCVAISRARAALYICANVTTLISKSHWKTLVEHLRKRECVGEHIPLRCPRHEKDQIIRISSHDFPSSWEQGLLCGWPCKVILPCKHRCQSTCHFGEHPRCAVPVNFIVESCGHEATRKCYESEEEYACAKEIIFSKSCGHTDVFPCWKVSTKDGFRSLKCMRPCSKKLKCLHPCGLLCFQDCKSSPCFVCLMIEKDTAKKELEREIKENEEKHEQVAKEIKELSKQQGEDASWIESVSGLLCQCLLP